MIKTNFYRLLLIFLFILGSILPFIPILTILFVFIIIPIAIAVFVSIMALLMGLIASNKLLKINALKTILALLVFLGSPIVLVLTVDKFLHYRSEVLIGKLDAYKKRNNSYPTDLNQLSNNYSFGIEYHSDGSRSYELEYSRGFMVKVVYSSTNKNWESFGWND